MANFKSVQAFAARAAQLLRLDILIENVGIETTRHKSAKGHESSITVNIISTFLLALLLLSKMKETAKKFPSIMPHLSIVTSEVHAWTDLPGADLSEWKMQNTFQTLDCEDTANM